MRFALVLFTLLWSPLAYGQEPVPVEPVVPEVVTIKLPETLNVKAGRIVRIDADTTGKKVRWLAVQLATDAETKEPVLILPEDVDLYPVDESAHSVFFCCPTAGTMTLFAWTAGGDYPTPPAICRLVIEQKGPRPPPDPNPPGPTPDPKPTPIPTAGNRVLIVYESDLAEMVKLPPTRAAILTSTVLRAYLTAHQVEGRFLDKDTEFTTEPQVWRDAMKLPRDSVPWIYVSNGKTGYSGPLPENVADTLVILKKYFGE
jgi:hypothetical protein